MSSSTQTLHFLSLLSLLSLFSPAHSTTTTTTDLHLLLDLKTSLQTPTTSTFFSSWQPTNPPCNFTGVTCDATNQITQLDLSNQRLTGSLPFHSICRLKSLQTLSLGHNQLHGPITDHLRDCLNLRYLDLGTNFFSGPFPDVSSLNKLTHLYLNNSGLSGAFPWASLRNMTGLVVLSLGDNQFDRCPFPEEIVELVRLKWLYLSNCSIEGRIPKGIGNLTELVNLELSRNYLTGEIPVEISKLKKLWQLELYYNSFTGRFPVGFGNLTNLENFDASENYLEGDLLELRTLNNLVSLQLYGNGFSGEIPAEFGEFGRLVNLSLYENKLTGTIPQALGSKSEFIFIDASENFLSGPIPPDMCKQGKMIKLLLLQNNLTGDIPVSYANCLSLIRLRLSNNLLSGVVPSGIWGLPQIGLIDLAMNQFEGSITSDIGNAKALSQLIVGNNKFSGELPLEIAKATALIEIDLSDNRFSGKIPSPICALKLLSRLNLQKNMFSGPIPETIGNCVAFNDINMAANSLSGGIPASIGSLPSLNSLNLSENELSGQIPATLSSLKLSLLDLSNNRLIGPIPSSLSLEAYNGSFAGNNGLCSQNFKFFRGCSSNARGSQSFWLIILGVAAGAIMLLLLIPCVLYLKKGSHKDEERSLKEDSWDLKSFHILSFTEEEILDSIKQENLIGKGGSGKVYKVLLPNGTELAVKHIWNSDSGGRKRTWGTTPMLTKRVVKSKEFEAEVETLSSIRHVNVVKLYCSIMSEDSSLLVYEYLPNGSLWDRLHMCGKMGLDWETRYEIAVGAAKGLEYLHHGLERPLIHRDVKSSNILLDEFFKPRIADFGLAKIVKGNKSKESTHVIVGTHGYIAPEYGYTYKVNEKSDIYSFGVVLMELVTGRRPIEPEYGENQDIVNWVSTKLTKEAALSIVDSNIREVHREEAIKVLRIAILCTARLPNMRPTMRSVVQMLEEAEPCKFIGIIISKVGRSKKEEVKDCNCEARPENETNPSHGV